MVKSKFTYIIFHFIGFLFSNMFSSSSSDFIFDHDCDAWYERENIYIEKSCFDDPNKNDISIIITFHEENPYRLIETIESVLKHNNSVKYSQYLYHLKEILLIDDFSAEKVLLDQDYLKKNNIHLHRNEQREGLMRSRNLGANVATGSILVFLDSHVIVQPYWLESLVVRLRNSRCHQPDKSNDKTRNPDLVVSPVIDAINPDGSYMQASGDTLGGFSSNFSYVWELCSEKVRDGLRPAYCRGQTDDLDFSKCPGTSALPRPMPVLAGGVFATFKDSFDRLGQLDPGMEIWGGENVEFSVRVWACGGRIELVPCSHVGHHFRPSLHPYSFPRGKVSTVLHNLKRIALLWLPHGRSNYTTTLSFEHQLHSPDPNIILLANFYQHAPLAQQVDAGDLTERRELIDHLQCHDFSWYLRNVYPMFKIPAVADIPLRFIRNALIELSSVV